MTGHGMFEVSRRSFLRATLSPVLALSARAATEVGTLPLKELARAKGILYGTCISAGQITAEDDFTALVLRECDCIVPENEMKWWSMSHRSDEEDFSVPDRMMDFAKRFHLAVRGHNLLWYFSVPDWFKALPDRRTSEAAVLIRIAHMVSRYRGRVFCWDVVNEPIYVEHGRDDNLRRTVFVDKIGPQYLDLAYRAARSADPEAGLVVNEYDLEYDTPEQDAKRMAVLKLLERMKAAGTPIDALGIQAHLVASHFPFSPVKLKKFLAEVAAMGLEIQITELDSTDEFAPAPISERDRCVADQYRQFLETALDEPAVKILVTWGLSDRHSWIVRGEVGPVALRKDGLPSRPLPFDAALAPKPAWAAIAQALQNAPPRQPARSVRL
jgi:endo-1,4-beta-xylanase